MSKTWPWLDYDEVRLNEYYVSQYVDHVAFVSSGTKVSFSPSRQNQSMGGQEPLVPEQAPLAEASVSQPTPCRFTVPLVAKIATPPTAIIHGPASTCVQPARAFDGRHPGRPAPLGARRAERAERGFLRLV